MVEKSELLRVPVFANLPPEQIDWFISQSREISLAPDEIYIREGDPAEAMFVVLEGQQQVRGVFGGETITISTKSGDVGGVLPFSRMKQASVTGRALTPTRLLRFPASLFPELIQKMPELAQRLVGLMSDRIRETTRIEQQKDRLVALGKLSAGLAHELNNPASAAKRATSQLRGLLSQIRNASHELGRHELTPAQKAEIEKLETSLALKDGPPPDGMTMSNLEEEIDASLRSYGQDDLWQLSANLAHKGAGAEIVEALFRSLEPATARAALVRISASIEISSLLNEIESSTSRISDLVLAIKEYTYMDQSPVQNVDIVKSLETTLIILNHKLKKGVTIHREYLPIPLLVDSFGSELNQIWTNIIDNAIYAMKGKGDLRVRTYLDDGCVVVEIGDNGPGIPPEVQPHIFEPFFTTKGVGEGTGLGLDTVQRIVRKHRGNINVTSAPGDTRFQVFLPLSEAKKSEPASANSKDNSPAK
ncbi:MAG TPA: ATP-binding protein [Candidatus Angelobacter sp.]|nr:ATP-binding protein [Candidatus Angelobacter sp.]